MEKLNYPMFITASIVCLVTFLVAVALMFIVRDSHGIIAQLTVHFRHNRIFRAFISRARRWRRSTKVESKCANPNCIRCLNAAIKSKDLLERLRAYAEDNNLKSELQRLEGSLTGSYYFSESGDRENTTDNQKSVEKTVQRKDQKIHGSGSMTQKLNLQQPTVLYVRGLRAVPWHDGIVGHSKFKNDMLLLERVSTLEVIKQEFEGVKCSDTGWSKNESDEGAWELFYFFNQGQLIKENCAKCPQTVEIIRRLKNFMEGSVFGNACFSVVHPNTHIARHTGPTNCRLRCHLLLSGGESCSIEVASVSRSWPEGRALVFDDSFPHSVTHSGANLRCVLLIDFWHPDLTTIEMDCLRSIFLL